MRMSDAEWDAVIAVNLTAAFRLMRGAVRGMMKARWGRIVSVTSIVGVTGNPGQGNYAASKAGLIGMSKSLAAEVATRPRLHTAAQVMASEGVDRADGSRWRGRSSLAALEAQAPEIQHSAQAIANAAENWRFPDQK
jgi:NAD(P)-dependent dehydrogenase (short-subunit alcohol dehydrogenase family)